MAPGGHREPGHSRICPCAYKDRLAQLRNDASGLARALDVPLADLPKWKGIPKEDAPLAVQYLLTGSPAEQLRTKYGHEYQATYDLATMVNLAMLLYSPGSEQQTKSISTFMEAPARAPRFRRIFGRMPSRRFARGKPATTLTKHSGPPAKRSAATWNNKPRSNRR